MIFNKIFMQAIKKLPLAVRITIMFAMAGLIAFLVFEGGTM